MTMIDRQQRLLSPEQLAEWTPAHRRMYARRLPKSWPRVREMLARSELAAIGYGAPEPAGTPPEGMAPPPYVPIVFGKSFDPGRRRVSIAEIVEACAKCAMVSVTEMRSPRRARTIVRPRQVAMYLADKHTERSLVEIGKRLGGKDHSTVLYAKRKVQDDINAGGEVFGRLTGQVERELGLGGPLVG